MSGCLRSVRVDWRARKAGYVPRPRNAAIARRLDAGEALGASILRVAIGADDWPSVEFAIAPASRT